MPRAIVLLPFYAEEQTSKIIKSLTSVIDSFVALKAPYTKIVCLAFDGDDVEPKMAEIAAFGFHVNREDVSIVVSHNQYPTGLQHNLNSAIKMMNPQNDDLFLRVDCDDEMYRVRIEAQCSFMARSPYIDIVASRADVVRFGRTHISPKSFSGEIRKTDMFLKNQVVHSSVCFRGSVFSRFGYYDNMYRYGQDYEFWLRVLSQGGRIHILPEVLVRLHQGGNTVIKRLRAQRYYFSALRKWRQLHWLWFCRVSFTLLMCCVHSTLRLFQKKCDG